jgi:hypothetical protein
MGPPRSPIFGTYKGHFCGRSDTMELGGQNWVPQKTQIETQNWCQFLSPSFETICKPRDAISKYINPACQVETVSTKAVHLHVPGLDELMLPSSLRTLLDLDLHSMSPHFYTKAVLGWGLAPLPHCLVLNLFRLVLLTLTFLSVGIGGGA